jgi:hypothetical protein
MPARLVNAVGQRCRRPKSRGVRLHFPDNPAKRRATVPWNVTHCHPIWVTLADEVSSAGVFCVYAPGNIGEASVR